jgi:hypothetical protein
MTAGRLRSVVISARRPGAGARQGIGPSRGHVPVAHHQRGRSVGLLRCRLWSYELFAGRAIRLLGGRDPGLPFRSRSMITARKIVSSIGMTEICPVCCPIEGEVEPIASFTEIGLMAAVRADGFVIVPETREGYPPGASVNVYLYDNC